MAVDKTLQDVRQPGVRLNVTELGGGYQRNNRRPSVGTALGAGKKVILAKVERVIRRVTSGRAYSGWLQGGRCAVAGVAIAALSVPRRWSDRS